MAAEHDGPERLERAMDRHQEVPEDLVAAQVAKVEEAVHLLGDDPELADVAELAIDSNLDRVEDALGTGADLAGPDDEPT